MTKPLVSLTVRSVPASSKAHQSTPSISLETWTSTLQQLSKNRKRLYLLPIHDLLTFIEQDFQLYLDKDSHQEEYKQSLQNLQAIIPPIQAYTVFFPAFWKITPNSSTIKQHEQYTEWPLANNNGTMPSVTITIKADKIKSVYTLILLSNRGIGLKQEKGIQNDMRNFAAAIITCTRAYSSAKTIKITIHSQFKNYQALLPYLYAYQQMRDTLAKEPIPSFFIHLESHDTKLECSEQETQKTIDNITRGNPGLQTLFSATPGSNESSDLEYRSTLRNR